MQSWFISGLIHNLLFLSCLVVPALFSCCCHEKQMWNQNLRPEFESSLLLPSALWITSVNALPGTRPAKAQSSGSSRQEAEMPVPNPGAGLLSCPPPGGGNYPTWDGPMWSIPQKSILFSNVFSFPWDLLHFCLSHDLGMWIELFPAQVHLADTQRLRKICFLRHCDFSTYTLEQIINFGFINYPF